MPPHAARSICDPTRFCEERRTGDRMAAHRKSDRRRDGLCEGGLRKRGTFLFRSNQSLKSEFKRKEIKEQ
jgi:hypothetical protein